MTPWMSIDIAASTTMTFILPRYPDPEPKPFHIAEHNCLPIKRTHGLGVNAGISWIFEPALVADRPSAQNCNQT